MKVKKFMTKKVITVTDRSSLYDCVMKFSKNHIGGVPVVNRKREVMGIVDENDITKALDILTPRIRFTSSRLTGLLFAALRSKREEDQLLAELQQARKIKVPMFMTKPPSTISQDASLMEAIKRMNSDDITHVPVVDNKGKLVGIIARADVIRTLTNIQLHSPEEKTKGAA